MSVKDFMDAPDVQRAIQHLENTVREAAAKEGMEHKTLIVLVHTNAGMVADINGCCCRACISNMKLGAMHVLSVAGDTSSGTSVRQIAAVH